MIQDEQKRFTLRIEKELFERVKQSAFKNRRAVGREIEYILEKALKTK